MKSMRFPFHLIATNFLLINPRSNNVGAIGQILRFCRKNGKNKAAWIMDYANLSQCHHLNPTLLLASETPIFGIVFKTK